MTTVTEHGLREDRLIAIGRNYKAHAERLADALAAIEREASCLEGLRGDIPLTRFAVRIRKMAKKALAAWEEGAQ
jgi:ATP phosphoribosyltransferase regulatory subunit HisZ